MKSIFNFHFNLKTTGINYTNMNNDDRPRRKVKRKRYNEDEYWEELFSEIENEEPKRPRTGYYNDLSPSHFRVNDISDLIKLGFLYCPTEHNPFFQKLFKLIVPLMKLDNLIGMKDIKKEIVSQIMYFIQGFNERDFDGSMLHCAIYGPPGTGKTHVSTIVGEIYRAMGFLKTDKITYGSRTDFIADYLGQTANKTKRFLDRAKGGVIIIDEIYSLASGTEDHDSYAKEAIDTINQFLSENKKDTLCIVIGYKEEVQRCFFALNKGLDRRFPFRYTIKKYTSEELRDIFLYQVNLNGWTIDAANYQCIVNAIKSNPECFENFGGDTENYFLACKKTRARRLFGRIMNNATKYILDQEDLQKGVEDFIRTRFETIAEKNSVKHMYI